MDTDHFIYCFILTKAAKVRIKYNSTVRILHSVDYRMKVLLLCSYARLVLCQLPYGLLQLHRALFVVEYMWPSLNQGVLFLIVEASTQLVEVLCERKHLAGCKFPRESSRAVIRTLA